MKKTMTEMMKGMDGRLQTYHGFSGRVAWGGVLSGISKVCEKQVAPLANDRNQEEILEKCPQQFWLPGGHR
jgi:hypothetical protein